MAAISAWSDLDGRLAERCGDPDVCIIGAGPSGLTVAKALHARGIAFDCFEKGSDIGGMWRYQNDSGLSAAYASLHIDTSRRALGYSDFPVPEAMPDYLSHRQVLQYLERYADHFDLRRLVTFRSAVDAVTPAANGRWRVHLLGGRMRTYGTVVIASGHLSEPRMPAFPGRFLGVSIHSQQYRTPQPFEGRRVLVVGLGNSAVDIAVDLSRHAESVTVSTRSSAWIMPKYLLGRPMDDWSGLLAERLNLPTWLARSLTARLARLANGDQRRFGLRQPDHPVWREHATLSQDLLACLGHGTVAVKPNIRRFDGMDAVFEDGSRTEFDVVIYATGYRTAFPFLARSLFDPEADAPHLYRRMVSLAQPGLMFAGLIQPVGSTMPLVEVQGRWLAALIAGDIGLPEPDLLRREVDEHRRHQADTYLPTERHMLEVDGKTYARRLQADIGRGEVARAALANAHGPSAAGLRGLLPRRPFVDR